MRNIFILCSALLWSSHLLSQTAIIRGTVAETPTKNKIPFAQVYIEETKTGTTTDVNGYYEIKELIPGDYHLITKCSGYILSEKQIRVVAGSNQTIDFMLEFSSIESISDDAKNLMNEITIEGTQASISTPMTYNEIGSKEIAALNNGQDMPYLLRFTPSLVATSDAGNGVGYTGLWIRGSDPSRINVTINGIPINDPESHQVFWVNTPDLGSSSNNIQIQRGIGTSSNGAGSFGGSIKIDTRNFRTTPYAEISNSLGSFNTTKNTISFGTGILKERFVLEGRLSRIWSDGYIDRAKSDLKSFFIEGNYLGKKTTIKLNVFGGREQTYQSWNGTPACVLSGNRDSLESFAHRNGLTDSQTDNLIRSGRTYNFYEYNNQVDHYGQDHYQAHISHLVNQKIRLNASVHFTHGEGYFEEFKTNQQYSDYGLDNILINEDTSITQTDLVRRRWLKNDFAGFVGSIAYKNSKLESILGGALNEYRGNHFGELIWMQYAGSSFIEFPYYKGKSRKMDANIYWRNTYSLYDKIDLYADIQLRSIDYETKGIDNDLKSYDIHDRLLFFNPKMGIKFKNAEKKYVYASVAKSGKEPNRNDYVDASITGKTKPEEMIDLEAGYSFNSKSIMLSANAYLMTYKNQLVLTGELNDVGAPLRTNVNKSFRRGIELQAGYHFGERLSFAGNLTMSQNKIIAFKEIIYDYSIDFEELEINHRNTDISFSPALVGSGRLSYSILKKVNSIKIELMSKYVGKQYLDNTQNESLSLDPYFINDLILSYNIASLKGIAIDLAFTVNNVFNELYSSNGYTYSYIIGKRITEVFYYPQAGRNYNFNINLKF